MQRMVGDPEGMAEGPEGPDEGEGLVAQLTACTNDPLAFVRLVFPKIKPERWQAEVLQEIADQLAENQRLGRFKPIQIAICSGNGVGKSTLMSWIILWTLATYEDSLGVATAGSESQLRVRLWGELARQFSQMPDDLRGQFEFAATAIYSKQSSHTWRFDARAWSPLSQESFSGLHNYGRRVTVLYDEASMIAEPIWRATDGMLNDAMTQTIWIVCGNGVRLDGRFRQCFPGQKFAGLWKTFSVDSRDVTLTSKEAIAEKIEFYGEDSNYCRVHVRGLFPTASAMGLIPADVVEMASVRESWDDPRAATVIGADVASGHGEASSCIVIRRGLNARDYEIRRFPSLDPIQFSYRIAQAANEVNADGVFIDSGGVGEGVVGKLRELNVRGVHPVFFGAKSDNPSGVYRCANKRAELWTSMLQWLKEGGCIPADRELMAELVGPEYSENPQGIVLEKKEHMAERGLKSPDSGDALALTFAYPVYTAAMGELGGRGDWQVTHEYNPFGEREMEALRTDRPLPQLSRRYVHPDYPLKPEFDPDAENRAGWTRGGWSGDDDAGTL
jgi:hypothetical protein